MCSLRPRGTALFQSNSPVRRSNANVNRLSAVHAVKKMCFSRQDRRRLPRGQIRLPNNVLPGPNSSGRASAEPTPELFGPRNPGQFAAVSVGQQLPRPPQNSHKMSALQNSCWQEYNSPWSADALSGFPMQPVKQFPVGASRIPIRTPAETVHRVVAGKPRLSTRGECQAVRRQPFRGR